MRTSKPVSPAEPANFAALHTAVLRWFEAKGRDLPWRRTRDPYAILVAETMLQQTQVDRVVPRWERFLCRFPTVDLLAAATPGDVLREWSGLGYNGRALRLHRAAARVVERHGGVFPRDEPDLVALPGVGLYTAAAIRCFANELPVAMIDTNHRRVLGRLLVGPDPGRIPGDREFLALAMAVLPAADAWRWNQALMDLGATTCTAKAPACGRCPARAWCASGSVELRETPASYVVSRQGRFEGSNRWWRGRIVRALARAGGPVAFESLCTLVEGAAGPVREALRQLEGEGLVVQHTAGWSLP